MDYEEKYDDYAAQQFIRYVHGDTQWSQEVDKPDWAVAILAVLMKMDERLERMESIFENMSEPLAIIKHPGDE